MHALYKYAKNDNIINNSERMSERARSTEVDEKRLVQANKLVNECYTIPSIATAKKNRNEIRPVVSFWKQRKCHIECETKRFQNGHNQIGKNYIYSIYIQHTYMHIFRVHTVYVEWARKINNNRCRGR